MRDVAAAAGVSLITVSRAVRQPETVTADTRRRVQAAMRAIGYLPNLAARGLVSQRSHVVAAVVPAIDNPVYAATVAALADALRPRGIEVMIGNSAADQAVEEAVVTALLARRPDGIVLTGADHTPRLRRMLRQAAIPVVETWDLASRPIDMDVGFDNGAAQAALVRALVGRGYRRFAYLSGPFQHSGRIRKRVEGARAALAEAGLALPDALLFVRPASGDAGCQVVDAILDQRHGVDALVCGGDVFAVAALLGAQRRGARVPTDLAIAGFGGFEIGALLTPALTTVEVRGTDIGAAAARLLLDRLDGKPVQRTVDVGFSLALRGST